MKQPAAKTAVVVGVGTLGYPTALKLLEEGVTLLIVTNRKLEKARQMASALRAESGFSEEEVRIIPFGLDVCNSESIEAFVERLGETLDDCVDIFVITSGGNSPEAILNKRDEPLPRPPAEALSRENRLEYVRKYGSWTASAMKEMYAANVCGPAELMYRVLPLLIVQDRPPVIFTIGSVSPQLSGVNHYAAAKCALVEETKRVALFLASDRRQLGLVPGRAICVRWGFTVSEQSRGLLEGPGGRPTFRGEGIINGLPLGEMNQAEELAAAIHAAYSIPAFNISFTADGGFSKGVVVV